MGLKKMFIAFSLCVLHHTRAQLPKKTEPTRISPASKIVIKFPLHKHFPFFPFLDILHWCGRRGRERGRNVKICSSAEINKFAKQFDKKLIYIYSSGEFYFFSCIRMSPSRSFLISQQVSCWSKQKRRIISLGR